MPPKPNSVDGVTKQAVPAPPHSPIQHSAALNEEIKKEQQSQTASVANTKVKTSKESHRPIIIILLTIIFMAALIGLAYYAYIKSR